MREESPREADLEPGKADYQGNEDVQHLGGLTGRVLEFGSLTPENPPFFNSRSCEMDKLTTYLLFVVHCLLVHGSCSADVWVNIFFLGYPPHSIIHKVHKQEYIIKK